MSPQLGLAGVALPDGDLPQLACDLLGELEERRRVTLTSRTFVPDRRTYDSLAAELGVGRERVRQLETSALQRLARIAVHDRYRPLRWRAASVDAGAGRRWRPPNISSLSRARDKLGADPLHMLFEHAAGLVAADGAAGVSCCGLRVISVDGSTTDVPDSPPNVAFFGRPSTAGRDGAFPQVRWVAAAESGTGSLAGAAFGPYTTGEQALALDLLPCFGPGMLVLADRNFLSWSLARDVLATGAHILWRASASFTLKPARVLPDGTYLAELKPPRKADGPPIAVRVIEYTVHTTAQGDGGETSSEVFCLVTDLLDAEEHPALDLACCYPDRWGCETVTGHHKTDMGEGQPVLRSKDPEGVAQEMWALFAVYQAICQLIGAGVDAAGIPRTGSASRTHWPPRPPRSRLSPLGQLGQALKAIGEPAPGLAVMID